MSIIDSILNFLGAILDFIKDNWIIILIIVLIALSIFCPALWLSWFGAGGFWSWAGTQLAAVATFIAGLGLEGAVAVALGAAILIDPEGVGEAFGSVAAGIGEGAGFLFSSLLDSPIGILAIGAGAFFLISSLSDDNDAPLRDYQLGAMPEDELADDYANEMVSDDFEEVVVL
jgi:hypothetical protein